MKKYNKWVTLFLGYFGIHRYMAGEIGMGILYTFTFGLFGIGWIVDTIKAFSYSGKAYDREKTKKIIAYIILIISILLCIGSYADYSKTKDSIDFSIFGTFFVTLLISLFILTRSKKRATENNTQEEHIINNSVGLIQAQTQNRNFDLMEGHEFEYYCADLLGKNGFANVEVTKGSGDQGIDVIAYKDGIKYGIQCKCYTSDIGNKAVQEAFAGKTFYGCHVAAVLTNRYFTKSAKELAETNKVLLWDRDTLNSFIEKS